jgi:hypothetical protein
MQCLGPALPLLKERKTRTWPALDRTPCQRCSAQPHRNACLYGQSRLCRSSFDVSNLTLRVQRISPGYLVSPGILGYRIALSNRHRFDSTSARQPGSGVMDFLAGALTVIGGRTG